MNFSLLQKMCSIHAPSGSEFLMTEFILNYIEQNKQSWSVEPTVLKGKTFQDSIVLVFGKPKPPFLPT